MKEFIIILVQRIKSENPEFFKKLQAVAMWIMIADAFLYGLLYVNILPIQPDVHERLNTLCYAVGTFFAGTFFTTMATTKDPNLVSPDTKKAIEDQQTTNNQ